MCAELGRKVQTVSGSEAQVGVQGSKIGGSPQLPGWWRMVSGHRNAGKIETTDETSRGKSERDGRFRSTRIRFWVVGDSFLWSSDSGFPQSNQQVTVASTRPTLKGPALGQTAVTVGESTQGSGGQSEAWPGLAPALVPGEGGEADRSRWRRCLCIGWGAKIHAQSELGGS